MLNTLISRISGGGQARFLSAQGFTSSFKNSVRLNSGFTLAEVLITLGIIGVVAAMTMPSVIQNYKKKEASSRLKKFVSTMEQAVLFAEKDNGTRAFQWMDIDDYADDISENPQLEHDLNFAYWNQYFAPYVKSIKVENGVYVESPDENNKGKNTKIYFADGSTLSLRLGHCLDLYFDINGDKLPNQSGRDIFRFFIATNKSYKKEPVSEIYRNKSFAAVYMPLFDTREKALQYCKDMAFYCTGLLQYDNWEFKDDYPYKL